MMDEVKMGKRDTGDRMASLQEQVHESRNKDKGRKNNREM